MLARLYERDEHSDILFRKRIEDKLVDMFIERSNKRLVTEDSLLFDCREFGFCLIRKGGKPPEWFKHTERKSAKPKIAVSVTLRESDDKVRHRWQFAMSQLGFLYCVAYEVQTPTPGSGWKATFIYRSWQKHGFGCATPEAPSDAVCREAERLYYLKKGKKRK